MRHGLLEPSTIQRMLYDALDHSDDVVLILEQAREDRENIVVASANGAFCRLSGYDHAELTGKPLASLLAADADPARYAEFVAAAQEIRPFRSEMLCSRKAGKVFWFGLHLMPLPDTDPPSFVVLGRDITESLLAREQQAAIQGLLAKVFLCVSAPVAIVTDTGIIQMTNPAFDRLLGRPSGRLVGTRAVDYVAPNVRQAVVLARQRQAENGQDYTLVTRLLHADGSEILVEITSTTPQRNDLKNFRIVTVLRQPNGAPPTTVYIAGKIKLVGLDEVKQLLGDRWAAAAHRAMASAEHVIKRNCGKGDTYSRTADGSFLICFSGATEEEAAFRAAAIGREIRTRLIGEGETPAMASVSAITGAVDVPNTVGRSADMLATIIGERLNTRLAQIEHNARETLRQAIYVVTCRLEPVRNRRTREIVAQIAKVPDELEQKFLAAHSALPTNERQDFDFDRLVLGVAANQVIEGVALGGSLLTLVNVGFEVFLDRQRSQRYVAACQAIDKRLRDRLVLILSEMPMGLPSSRIMECVMRLRPFCHSVGFQSEGMDSLPIESSLLGASIAVFQERGPSPQTEKDRAKFAKLIEILHAYQARILVRHVSTREAAKRFASLGVDLISLVEDERNASERGGNN